MVCFYYKILFRRLAGGIIEENTLRNIVKTALDFLSAAVWVIGCTDK